MMMLGSKTRPRDGLYYDLIRIPHGYIPAPKVRLWSWLRIAVMQVRDDFTFMCPICGTPSFFKFDPYFDWCSSKCLKINPFVRKERLERYRKREKWRNRLKQIEYCLLPLLVLLRKAWYVESLRHHARDEQEMRVILTTYGWARAGIALEFEIASALKKGLEVE